jgi:hypothetical protein
MRERRSAASAANRKTETQPLQAGSAVLSADRPIELGPRRRSGKPRILMERSCRRGAGILRDQSPRGGDTKFAASLKAARALVVDRTETGRRDRHVETRPFRSSLLRGSRPWNSRIEYSSVSIAAKNLYSLRVNSSFFTISNSRTTPSAASSARESAPMGGQGCARKHGRPARHAEQKPPSPSGQRRDGRCCAARASRSRRWVGARRRLFRLRSLRVDGRA